MSGVQIQKFDWNTPTNKAGLDRLVNDQLRTEIAKAAPPFLRSHVDRLIRSMITSCQINPALFDCSPVSLFGGVIQAAQLGLTIGGPLGESFLVPFYSSKKKVKEATLIVGYKGFIQLAHRSAVVRRITPRVVHEGDVFDFRYGSNQTIIHQPVRNNDRSATDYYVIVETITGGLDFETATREEMIRHRDRFSMVKDAPEYVKSKSPWYDNGHLFDEMCLKTLVRRMAKRMPLSVEMSVAAGLDEMADAGIPQRLDQHVPQGGGVEDELQGRLDGERPEHVPGVGDPDLDTNDGRK